MGIIRTENCSERHAENRVSCAGARTQIDSVDW